MFDTRKIMKQIEESAGKAVLDAANKAKRSLGAEGQAIQIKPLRPPRRRGNDVTYADFTFPSEAVKTKFLAAFKRNLK